MQPAQPGLVDLVNELERRLTGDAPGPGLPVDVGSSIPEADTYVLVVLDGLGSHQLAHPQARDVRECRVADLEAPFPTTTTVSLSTIATGLPPGGHGAIGHLVWLEHLGEVVNTLKWVTLRGTRANLDTSDFLPAPNLWERLAGAGVEPITIQPAGFADTPFSRATYRGCRFEGVYDEAELVDATVALAATPSRFIMTYLSHVDVAAHVWGQTSEEYAAALKTVDDVWSRIRHRLPGGTVVVATADHGHIDYADEDKILVRSPDYDDLLFYGDSRSLLVKGTASLIDRLADETGARVIRGAAMMELFGPITHPEVMRRIPDAVVLAPDGKLLLPRGFDKRLTGYHGGLDPREVTIPLLVG